MKISATCVACAGERLQRRPAVLMPFVAARVFGWSPVEVTAAWGLRDLESGHAYPLCASMMCEDCGMIFLDMRFDDAEMAALYDDYRGPAYQALRERFEPGYTQRNTMLLERSDYLEIVERFLATRLGRRDPRVLDWGGGSGANTPFRGTARRHDVYDISKGPLVSGARAIAETQVVAENYDLLVYANVLEHVADPRRSLRRLANAMTAKTLLYVEVPFEDLMRLHAAADARLELKRHWHEHINFFTDRALDAAFSAAGLEIVQRTTEAVVIAGQTRHIFMIAARLR